MQVATILGRACQPSFSNKQHQATPLLVLTPETPPGMTHPQPYIPQVPRVITHPYPVPQFYSLQLSHMLNSALHY